MRTEPAENERMMQQLRRGRLADFIVEKDQSWLLNFNV
jgi:hypothetical protein